MDILRDKDVHVRSGRADIAQDAVQREGGGERIKMNETQTDTREDRSLRNVILECWSSIGVRTFAIHRITFLKRFVKLRSTHLAKKSISFNEYHSWEMNVATLHARYALWGEGEVNLWATNLPDNERRQLPSLFVRSAYACQFALTFFPRGF